VSQNKKDVNDPGRREFVRWSVQLSAGIALAPLAGCGGGGDGSTSTKTADTLPDPEVLASQNGSLSLTLSAKYTRQSFTFGEPQKVFPGIARTVATELRSFNGRYLAPTLRLKAGDTLRILLQNELPGNVTGQSSLRHLNYQNSTNLHFHGLHVDPREIRPGVFGDYVVDYSGAGVLPGATRQHELAIPRDHTGGIYWYHPHLHGSTNTQVSSGMFGAILIEDPSDQLLAGTGIRERVIFTHKLTVNSAGRTDSFYDTLVNTPSAFLLNGAFQPTLVMRPGEVQVWHFVNSASFRPFHPVLDDHTMLAFARDGVPYDQRFLPVNRLSAANLRPPEWPGAAVYPGGRLSVIVRASDTPGAYYLRSAEAPSSDGEEIVARLVVEGEPAAMSLPPPSRLARPQELKPITDEEFAASGGRQRTVMLSIEPKDSPRLPQPLPAGEDWFVPATDIQNFITNLVFAAGKPPSAGGTGLAVFQSWLAEHKTVPLNAVEEWTLINGNAYPHPFHIHVNECYVTKLNGEAITPFWADTLPIPPNGSLTFRSRFTDFTGSFVWHCHALDHEDMGMMQLVEVRA